MSLSAGSRIGVYEVHGSIGSGGMGEVFRATDSRLHREVAIKVLPDAFADDPDRMARFQREAQVLASVNHPNIASVYGLEEHGPVRALVMELVEGEDLACRLQRGPLPLDEALRVALQIAEALETAHERGIVHRDLKPANIKVAPDGRVKVLDFGLAKSVEQAPGDDPAHSPTLSIAATQAGLILGTAAYMSPEQATGGVVDKRSDVWSFGVVCFELLSGRRLFDGETVTHTLADVLRGPIDWNRLPKGTPLTIRHLLERCLERDRRRRLRDIGEARIILEEHLSRAQPTAAVEPRDPGFRQRWRGALPWAAAGLLVGVLATAGVTSMRRAAPAAAPSLILNAVVSDEPLFANLGPAFALSTDGKLFSYVTDRGGDNRALYLLTLDGSATRTLAEGSIPPTSPYHPFFSPDGQWVGYVTSTELRKVPVAGGNSITISSVIRSRGATWLPDDTIVFAAGVNTGLSRVSAAGGQPAPLTELDASRGEASHRWPQALPGGRVVLFTSASRSLGDFDNARIEVVNVATGERKMIHNGGTYAHYVPTGHIAFVSRGTLYAMPFDVERLEPTGGPVPVVQDVGLSGIEGAAQFAFANTGLFTFLPGRDRLPTHRVVWVDRDGNQSRLLEEPGTYANPRLSPDGRLLSLTLLRDGNWDIWIYDLERQVSTRFTFDDAADTEQVWSPDGTSMIFSSDRTGPSNLFSKPTDGSRQEQQITNVTSELWPTSWSPDGRFVLVTSAYPQFDVLKVSVHDGKVQPVQSSQFQESEGEFSPDGRWIAYTSTESGRPEIYVRSFSSGGGRWQVSDGGGAYPRWSRRGGELFYRTETAIMAVSVEPAGDALRTGRPQPVVTGAYKGGTGGIAVAGYAFADYEVSVDGRRFIVFPDDTQQQARRRDAVTFVTSWFDEVRRTVARSGPANPSR